MRYATCDSQLLPALLIYFVHVCMSIKYVPGIRDRFSHILLIFLGQDFVRAML